MILLRLLSVPLLAAALLLTAEGLYFSPVVIAQKERSAHSKKPRRFHYVCPMHEDVTSRKPGKCPKCRMKLEKKQINEPTEPPRQ